MAHGDQPAPRRRRPKIRRSHGGKFDCPVLPRSHSLTDLETAQKCMNAKTKPRSRKTRRGPPAFCRPRGRTRSSANQRGETPRRGPRKENENHENKVKLTPDESETGAPMPQLLARQQLLAELVAHYHSLR